MTGSKMAAVLLLGLAVTMPALARRGRSAAAGKPTTPTAAAVPGKSPAVARVGDIVITLEELDRAAASQLKKIHQQEYEVRSEVLAGLIQDELISAEAVARGVTQNDLFESEIAAKAGKPSPAEISQYFETAKARANGRSLAEVSSEIENLLTKERVSQRQRAYLAELTAKYAAEVLLEPPRSTITLRPGAPALGAADAPVTMVVWSDYQCPFCRRAYPTVEQILGEYKGQIRFVHLDYPLSNHARAIPASQAVHCAGEQGKFWEYNDNLYAVSGDLSTADFTRRAAELGLDGAEFETCIASNRHAELIQANYDDGAAQGVTATPAFFINGRLLVGAQPIDRFRAVINEELSRRGVSAPQAGAGAN